MHYKVSPELCTVYTVLQAKTAKYANEICTLNDFSSCTDNTVLAR